MGFEKHSSTSKISALVVDDDTIIQRIHRALLTKLGLEVNIAKNGKEALDLHRSGRSFDLIFMDMEMPIMDGPQVSSSVSTFSLEKIDISYFLLKLENHYQILELDNPYVSA